MTADYKKVAGMYEESVYKQLTKWISSVLIQVMVSFLIISLLNSNPTFKQRVRNLEYQWMVLLTGVSLPLVLLELLLPRDIRNGLLSCTFNLFTSVIAAIVTAQFPTNVIHWSMQITSLLFALIIYWSLSTYDTPDIRLHAWCCLVIVALVATIAAIRRSYWSFVAFYGLALAVICHVLFAATQIFIQHSDIFFSNLSLISTICYEFILATFIITSCFFAIVDVVPT